MSRSNYVSGPCGLYSLANLTAASNTLVRGVFKTFAEKCSSFLILNRILIKLQHVLDQDDITLIYKWQRRLNGNVVQCDPAKRQQDVTDVMIKSA